MAGVEKISVSLTAEMAALLNEAVKSGEYASSSEVIREALRSWQIRKYIELQQVEELRELCEEGERSGISPYRSVREIKEAAKKRYLAKQKTGKRS